MTIHSALRIHQSEAGYQTLAFYDNAFKQQLAKINTLITDGIRITLHIHIQPLRVHSQQRPSIRWY